MLRRLPGCFNGVRGIREDMGQALERLRKGALSKGERHQLRAEMGLLRG
jgi:hypothetical protein